MRSNTLRQKTRKGRESLFFTQRKKKIQSPINDFSLCVEYAKNISSGTYTDWFNLISDKKILILQTFKTIAREAEYLDFYMYVRVLFDIDIIQEDMLFLKQLQYEIGKTIGAIHGSKTQILKEFHNKITHLWIMQNEKLEKKQELVRQLKKLEMDYFREFKSTRYDFIEAIELTPEKLIGRKFQAHVSSLPPVDISQLYSRLREIKK